VKAPQSSLQPRPRIRRRNGSACASRRSASTNSGPRAARIRASMSSQAAESSIVIRRPSSVSRHAARGRTEHRSTYCSSEARQAPAHRCGVEPDHRCEVPGVDLWQALERDQDVKLSEGETKPGESTDMGFRHGPAQDPHRCADADVRRLGWFAELRAREPWATRHAHASVRFSCRPRPSRVTAARNSPRQPTRDRRRVAEGELLAERTKLLPYWTSCEADRPAAVPPSARTSRRLSTLATARRTARPRRPTRTSLALCVGPIRGRFIRLRHRVK
jgi:hypothetical protein